MARHDICVCTHRHHRRQRDENRRMFINMQAHAIKNTECMADKENTVCGGTSKLSKNDMIIHRGRKRHVRVFRGV